MERVSKKDLDAMAAMIDSMQGEPEAGRTPDSNTKAETVASKAMDAWGMADSEMRRKNKLKKIAGQ